MLAVSSRALRRLKGVGSHSAVEAVGSIFYFSTVTQSDACVSDVNLQGLNRRLPVYALMLLYYFVRNSLVAWLEALCVEFLLQLREHQIFPDIFPFFPFFECVQGLCF